MAEGTYEMLKDFNKEFCAKLPQMIKSNKSNEQPSKAMNTYLRRKQVVLGYQPIGTYTFKIGTGQDFLYTLLHIVNDRESYKLGNYFFFRFASDQRRDVMLVANPTKHQPGNGRVITTASLEFPPYNRLRAHSHRYLFNIPKYMTETLEGVENYFKRFMTQPAFSEADDNPRFFEISVLLVFEVARRLVSGPGIKYPKKKKAYDSVPVASCIAMCVLMENLKECLGVLREKPRKRKLQAKEILTRFSESRTANELVEMMKRVFNPNFQEDPKKIAELDKGMQFMSLQERSSDAVPIHMFHVWG